MNPFPWTPELDEQLAELLAQGMGYTKIAKRIGANADIVINRRRKLGLKAPGRRPWTAERRDVLIAEYATVPKVTDLLTRLNAMPGPRISHNSLWNKAKDLGIRRCVRPQDIAIAQARQRQTEAQHEADAQSRLRRSIKPYVDERIARKAQRMCDEGYGDHIICKDLRITQEQLEAALGVTAR